MEKINGDNLDHVRASLSPDIQAQIDQHIGVIIREINQFTGTYFGYDGNSALRGTTWRETFIKIMNSLLDDGLKKNAEYFGFSVDEIRATIRKHAPALDEVTTPRLL
ncbi:MAG: aminoglycoside phosphotransferase family protein, partial [Anaerolineae bacterium]|nr:aminoglycoside phosphotransferase family protein [Anaerolineae bacterium]